MLNFNKLLYWINILIFPIILFKLLAISSDFNIFHDFKIIFYLGRFTILLLAAYLMLVVLEYTSYQITDISKKEKLNRYQIYVVIAAIILIVIFNLPFLFSMGAPIVYMFILMTLSEYPFLKILTKTFKFSEINKTGLTIFTVALLFIFIALSYSEVNSLEVCHNEICRFKIFHKNPEICSQKSFYFYHCYIETAIYFSDPYFCDNINTGIQELTISATRDRCKRWVSYYKDKDYLIEKNSLPSYDISTYDPPGINIKLDNINETYTPTALIIAARRRDIELVKKLLDNDFDVNVQDDMGYTALMLASDSNVRLVYHPKSIQLVKMLLDHGADVDIRNKYGETALHIAKRYGGDVDNIDIVKLLSDKGSK